MLDMSGTVPEVLYVFPYQNTKVGDSRYHQHDFPEISIMVDGCADYLIGDQHHHITKGQVLVFNPHTWHQDSQPMGTFSYQVHIGFRNFVLPGIGSDKLPFANSVIDLGNQWHDFFAVVHQLIDENHRQALGKQLLERAMVTELLVYLLRALPENCVADDQILGGEQPSDSPAEAQALVTQATYYLNAHYDDDVSLARLAASLHVSNAHLSRLFKTVTGETPSNYLTRIRLQRAEELLQNDQLTIKEVANRVGYLDPLYFSKLFKKHFGRTPSAQR